MRFPCLIFSLVILFVPAHILANPSFFVITQPSRGDQWVNGQTNYVTWKQGLSQGISAFDVELVRMTTDGVVLVALNVPSSSSNLPITLMDVPPADDYFLALLNSTHGVMYSLSARFSILSANQTSNTTLPSPNGNQLLATVTVSGAPNPTSHFAYTFPASGAQKAWSARGTGVAVKGVLGVVGVVVGLWTVW